MSKIRSGSNESKFTWNSRVNHYHDSFEFTARFDRVFTSRGVTSSEYRLIGDSEFDGGYLSDHYGITVNITI